MPPIITQSKAVMFTVQDLLHTLQPKPETPFSGKYIHFIGIGGSGMSGLAHMLINFGAHVSGTDRDASGPTRKLSEIGATISYHQVADSIPAKTEIVVYSAAIKPDHPERIEAVRRGCEVIKYAQMLGRAMKLKHGVAIAGTHGKSTTTAMTAHILLSSGKDPSFVVGATVPQLGGSARSGNGDQFIVEACEFDRSFHNLYPHIGAVLNIEEDHLDYYKDIHEINESFHKFLSQIDPSGVALIAAGDKNCELVSENLDCNVETYGIDTPADWQATGIRRFQGKAHFQVTYKGKKMGRLSLSVAGRHNVGNATVAAAIATHCGVPWDKIATAVESFRGADRRSQLIGTLPVEGGTVTVVDDYGHHPTEVRATLLALREHYRPNRLVCVFQPHQHSRTRFLLNDFSRSFSHADVTIMPDIYFVRDSEADRKAVSSEILIERIRANGRDGLYIPTFKQIVEHLKSTMLPGDLIVSMGAGPVWEVTDELVRTVRGSGKA